jgi:hypothetical protein
MEISRIIHDNVEYIIGADIDEYKKEKIASPYIQVTSKTAKRKRGKKLPDKTDHLFKRISISNPIGLYRKILNSFNEFLGDYNYVTFQSYKDDKEKRTRVYIKALEKMGFKNDYIYVCPWDKQYKKYVMCREGYELKKKDYTKIFKSMYGSWYQDEYGNWVE